MKKFITFKGLIILLLFITLSCTNDKKEPQIESEIPIETKQGISTIQVVGKFGFEAQGKVDFGTVPHMTFTTKEGVVHKWDAKETFVSYFPPEVLEKRELAKDQLIESQKALIEAQKAQLKGQAKLQEDKSNNKK